MPRELVSATRPPDIVALPGRRCLAIDGAGAPKDAAFAALYAVHLNDPSRTRPDVLWTVLLRELSRRPSRSETARGVSAAADAQELRRGKAVAPELRRGP